MMDFEKKQEKKTGIIDTTQKQADIYSNPVMDTRSVQKNEYQHVIKPQSVNDILAEKKKGNTFLIYPEMKLNIGRAEMDTDKMDKVYNMGRKKGEEILGEVIEFLKD